MLKKRVCPGCALEMPYQERAHNGSYYNASPECWQIFTELLSSGYEGALGAAAHQLIVDAYAVQHAGGSHPVKSVGIHLCGLYLMIESHHPAALVPSTLQRLASAGIAWPAFTPPDRVTAPTVFDVALTDGQERLESVRRWAAAVWTAWSAYHAWVEAVTKEHLAPQPEWR